jgi:drug/metabolite transporter (DMT)-like permease
MTPDPSPTHAPRSRPGERAQIDTSPAAKGRFATTRGALPARSTRWVLPAQSVALVLLLASTWLVVGASLHEASAAVVSAGRTAFTVLGLAVLTGWLSRRGPKPVAEPGRHPVPDAVVAPRYRWWQVLLLAGTGVTAYTVFSTVAIDLAGPVLPTLVMALTPAVVLVGESVLARRPPSVPTVAGTTLAVAGAVVYVLPRLGGTLGRDVALGTAFALAAMLSMAFYGVYFARVNRGYRGAMAPRILPVFAVGTVPLAAWAAVAVASGETVSWAAVGLLAALGIVIYVPVYLLQHRIIVVAGASYAALLGLATPPLVGLSSALLHLAAVPAPVQIAGMAITVLGMAVVIARGRQLSRLRTRG